MEEKMAGTVLEIQLSSSKERKRSTREQIEDEHNSIEKLELELIKLDLQEGYGLTDEELERIEREYRHFLLLIAAKYSFGFAGTVMPTKFARAMCEMIAEELFDDQSDKVQLFGKYPEDVYEALRGPLRISAGTRRFVAKLHKKIPKELRFVKRFRSARRQVRKIRD